MARQLEQWSIEKVLTCLNQIVHPDVLPSLTKKELDQMHYIEMFDGEEKIVKFLKLLYKKSDGKLEIYGSVNDMMANIKKVDKIPELVAFSSNEEAKWSRICVLLKSVVGYTDTSFKHQYIPRSSIWINIYKCVAVHMKSIEIADVVDLFYFCWLTAFLNKVFRELNGTFDLIPMESRLPLVKELNTFFEAERVINIPKEKITIESFSKLRKYFNKNDEKLFNNALAKINAEMLAKNQKAFKEFYAEIIFLIENTKRIFDRHVGLSTPFAKSPSTPRKPVIRLLFGPVFKFLLAQEAKDAIEIVLKNRVAKYDFLGLQISCLDTIFVETKEERSLGIVYALHLAVLLQKIEKYNIKIDDFIVLQATYDVDFRNIAYPIISAHGTHCIPAMDAFENIIYFLAVILKAFQRTKPENLPKVFKFIENLVDSLFVVKPVIYLIELWKVDEILDKAREELSPLLTEQEYEVPLKETYDKNGVFREFEILTRNLGLEKSSFVAKANGIIKRMLKQPIYLKNIYNGYTQIMVHYLCEKYDKVNRFISNQTTLANVEPDDAPIEKQPKPEPEPKKPENTTFTGFKKGFLNKSAAPQKKQEPKKPEKIQEPSSTENAGNQNEKKLEEKVELEKLRKGNNELQKQLEAERAFLKGVKTNSENQVQQLQKEVEKSQKSKAEIEEKLKLELQTITVDFEEQVKKAKEDLKQSHSANYELEAKLKTMEQNHLEEIQNLKEDQENTENKVELLKGDLEREKTKNIELEEKSKTFEKECEELKEKVEFLMSENGQLRAESCKNTEFQQKIKEHSKTLENQHCGLVDSALSRLHRLCSNYPENSNLKEAKNDVMKFEDCLDEYVENVEKEFEKLGV